MKYPEKDTLMQADELSYKLYGLTIYTAISIGICLSCKQIVDKDSSDVVLLEYLDTGMCGSCFKDIFDE
tara:strand:- start:273 stop:479 length:207 start_codon:yes stop_codon:yes gene_type:complete